MSDHDSNADTTICALSVDNVDDTSNTFDGVVGRLNHSQPVNPATKGIHPLSANASAAAFMRSSARIRSVMELRLSSSNSSSPLPVNLTLDTSSAEATIDQHTLDANDSSTMQHLRLNRQARSSNSADLSPSVDSYTSNFSNEMWMDQRSLLYVCRACNERFVHRAHFEMHRYTTHPNVEVDFTELASTAIPENLIGLRLNGPDDKLIRSASNFKMAVVPKKFCCTKCGNFCTTQQALHAHMMTCFDLVEFLRSHANRSVISMKQTPAVIADAPRSSNISNSFQFLKKHKTVSVSQKATAAAAAAVKKRAVDTAKRASALALPKLRTRNAFTCPKCPLSFTNERLFGIHKQSCCLSTWNRAHNTRRVSLLALETSESSLIGRPKRKRANAAYNAALRRDYVLDDGDDEPLMISNSESNDDESNKRLCVTLNPSANHLDANHNIEDNGKDESNDSSEEGKVSMRQPRKCQYCNRNMYFMGSFVSHMLTCSKAQQARSAELSTLAKGVSPKFETMVVESGELHANRIDERTAENNPTPGEPRLRKNDKGKSISQMPCRRRTADQPPPLITFEELPQFLLEEEPVDKTGEMIPSLISFLNHVQPEKENAACNSSASLAKVDLKEKQNEEGDKKRETDKCKPIPRFQCQLCARGFTYAASFFKHRDICKASPKCESNVDLTVEDREINHKMDELVSEPIRESIDESIDKPSVPKTKIVKKSVLHDIVKKGARHDLVKSVLLKQKKVIRKPKKRNLIMRKTSKMTHKGYDRLLANCAKLDEINARTKVCAENSVEQNAHEVSKTPATSAPSTATNTPTTTITSMINTSTGNENVEPKKRMRRVYISSTSNGSGFTIKFSRTPPESVGPTEQSTTPKETNDAWMQQASGASSLKCDKCSMHFSYAANYQKHVSKGGCVNGGSSGDNSPTPDFEPDSGETPAADSPSPAVHDDRNIDDLDARQLCQLFKRRFNHRLKAITDQMEVLDKFKHGCETTEVASDSLALTATDAKSSSSSATATIPSNNDSADSNKTVVVEQPIELTNTTLTVINQTSPSSTSQPPLFTRPSSSPLVD